MTPPRLPLVAHKIVFALACLTLPAVPRAAAQAAAEPAAPAPAVDAATLAKYDKNHNGVLDPDEAAALAADQRQAVPVESTPAKTAGDDLVRLSPFQVTTETKGYYASNTMSGTRFNSKIEDLGASISVVTKAQMQDFAMLDINDVFLYTASTEGTGTYTDFTVDRNGSYSDNVELNPNQANRVRGIAAANISYGNFETTTRTPLDPLSVDSIEVSRGPNANVFGLGSPAGTVNQVPASANLTADHSEIQFRGDSYGGYRTSIDLNRDLVPNKLAIRGSAAFEHDAYERKPSGTNTVRYNGMIKYQPFKFTTISGSVQYYRINGNRPNDAPPRDNLTYWIASGKPTWDPVTQLIHLNGSTLGPFPTATGVPDYFTNSLAGNVGAHSQMFIDRNGLGYWTTPTATVAGPLGPNGTQEADRFMFSTSAAGVALGHITAQPLFTTTPSLSNKSLYDWSSINLDSINRIMLRTLTSNLQVDQILLNTPMQTLTVQGAFFREDTQSITRNLVGVANQNAQSGQLIVDVNERLLDGTPNPYFLRPFIGSDEPATTSQPWKWDTYRAQGAYQLDFTRQPGWLKWLGMHELTGYDEYKYRVQRQYRYRDVISDPHAWAPGNIKFGYDRFYVGDNKGSNVDYAPTNFAYGTYPLVWGDATTGVFNHEPALIEQGAGTDGSGAGNNTKTILKTVGVVLQSHLYDDRIIPTLGVREDRTYVHFGLAPTPNTLLLNADQLSFNYPVINSWAGGDWGRNSGRTTTEGIVVKPLRDMKFLQPMASASRAGAFLANLLGGLSLSYNRADSFTPQTPAQSLFLQPLPNTTGKGEDYGFALNMFDGKFVVRFNHYIDRQLNARNSDANTIATRVIRMDENIAFPFQLGLDATNWVTALNPGFSAAQIAAEVSKEIGLSQATINAFSNQSPPIAATNDVLALGNELEVNYNPSRFWTLAGSVTDNRAINSNISADVANWIAQRMPIWTTIKDPTINPAVEPQQLWWTHNYGGTQTAMQNFQTFIASPYAVITAQQGKARPEIRRYNARFSTNFRLAAITDNPTLKKFSVGGAVRWEDKGGLGYLGVQQLPAQITALNPDKPVFDPAHYFFDGVVSYRTRMWFDQKLAGTFQLNVRNIQENGGRLQPTAVFPDGTPSSYRIIDPRQFILSVTFDL